MHQRPARTNRGWRTALMGNPGFSDICAVHRVSGRLLFAELKVGNHKLTAEQEQWVEALRAAGVEVWIWRPEMWDDIVAMLWRSRAAPPAADREGGRL